MPSLHFGYSLLIGLTIALIPLASQEHGRIAATRVFGMRMPSARRLICVTLGIAYPTVILVAIIVGLPMIFRAP